MPTAPTDTRDFAPVAADSPVSIVHLVLTLNIGGLEKFVYDLARCTDRERYSVRVLCLDEVGALGDLFQGIGVPVESLGLHRQGVLRSITGTARRLRELRPDVLHTHNPTAHIIGAPAARLAGGSIVVHTRHGSHQVHGLRTKLAYRFASWLTQRMIPISSDSARVARAHDGVPQRKLQIIRNGIDLDLFPWLESPPRRLCRKAIHVARIDFSTKDQPTLLRAVRLVVDKQPEFALVIVGDGPDRPALERLCDELQLRPNVSFLGYRRDIHELLSDADVFVLSSVTEGISISILEAMAVGLPIVATDVGGNADVVVAGQTGLLAPARSPEALAGALLELMLDPHRAAALGLAGRSRVEQEFDMRRCAVHYEQLYQALLRA